MFFVELLERPPAGGTTEDTQPSYNTTTTTTTLVFQTVLVSQMFLGVVWMQKKKTKTKLLPNSLGQRV